MIWVYLIIAFIIFFFVYKLYGRKSIEEVIEKETSRWGDYSVMDIIFQSYIVLYFFLSLFWIITIPCFLAWKLLELLTRKIKFN